MDVLLSKRDACMTVGLMCMIIQCSWDCGIIIFIKTRSTGPNGKNKIVYKFVMQPHKHLHHGKQKNKLRKQPTIDCSLKPI